MADHQSRIDTEARTETSGRKPWSTPAMIGKMRSSDARVGSIPTAPEGVITVAYGTGDS